ncbi:MAG: cysteine desulfurase-like protein [Thermaerobacter sp.]|nr:cysteine desulfurase-like protein [Thermaerobacter sp.]
MPFDPANFRSRFPSLTLEVQGHHAAFFDGPGGSQVPLSVIDAQRDYYLSRNANTHGQFATSRAADETVDEARAASAAFLGAQGPETISFGQNMTTLNFALSRAVGRTLEPGDEVIVTDLEHDANVAPWLSLEERGVVVRSCPVRLEDCTLDMDAMRALIGPKTRHVAIGYASNAVGTVNDVHRVIGWAHAANATVSVDAVHFAPHALIDVTALSCDFLLCSAYKFFGPHVGLLYSRPGALDELPTDRVRPQDPSPPTRIETGTLNHAALAGVTAAIQTIANVGEGDSLRQRISTAFAEIYPYEHRLARRLWQGLADITDLTLYGPPVGDALRAPTIAFRIKDAAPEDVARRLGDEGLFVWDGDFYAVTLIEKLGLSDKGGVVRVGMAPYILMDEVDRLLAAIRKIAK